MYEDDEKEIQDIEERADSYYRSLGSGVFPASRYW